MNSVFLQKLWRKLELTLPDPASVCRGVIYALRGAQIGRGTRLPPCQMVWPHQVRIGENCILQRDIFFNYDHYWTPGPSILIGNRVFLGKGVEFNCRDRIEIGDDALIASGCKFIDHDHGREHGVAMNLQENISGPISIGKGAWLGANVIVLRGVSIGERAVIGAGAVVTKSVPAGETWGGIPAKKIGRSPST